MSGSTCMVGLERGRARARSAVVVVVAAMALGAALAPLTPSAGAGVTVIDRAVVAKADDAEEASNGSVDLGSSDLELTTEVGAQTVGIRFTGLAIPPAATVTDAWVQFEVDEVTTGATSLVVRAQDADTAATFTTATANISTRPVTSAFTVWNPAPWPTVQVAGLDQRTPSLAAVIQEVVNRPGWVTGNAIAVVITGTGRRTAESFNGTRAPILHVEVTTDVGPPTNVAPTVSAGLDQLVTLPASTMMAGIVGDDGQPAGSTVTQSWSQVNGPGTAVFVDPTSPTTAVSFTAPGIYQLRLTGSDTSLSTSDDVIVDVQAAASAVSQVHYSFTGPTSVAVDWRGGAGEIRYGSTADYGTTVQAQPPSITPISSGGPFWEASITGLDPNASYHYSIDGGPDAVLSTTPTGTARFVAAGDIGSSFGRSRITGMMASIAADAPAFFLGLGDLTYGNRDGQVAVDRHFDDVMAWSRTAAYMPAWGNHEWDSPTDDLRNYKGRFALPNAQTSVGAPTAGCCGEDWGWFDSAGVRFIAYPERYTSATWTEWSTAAEWILADAQANPSINFVVTFGHRPAYTTGNHTSEVALAAILDRYGDTYSKYVLDLNGHSHVYERFVPIHNVVHITAGSGGRSVEPPWGAADPRTAFRAHHLARVRVDVTPESLHIDAICGPATADDDTICADGAVLDSITINKPGVVNRPPVVAAGPDTAVVRPNLVSLAGSTSDDGLPSGSVVAALWTRVSGPCAATFTDPTAPTTTVGFSAAGTYVLRLTGSDGELDAFDDVTIGVSDPGAVSLDRAVAISSDDAEESLAGVVDLTSSDLELVTDGTVVQSVGLRFGGISIPRGAVITNAYVQFEVDETASGATSLMVRGQAADNAATFAKTTRNISSRVRTSASVPWVPVAWPTVQLAGPSQRTPNLGLIIAEITGRTGWNSGNALALILTGTGRRTAESFNGTRAPVLHVEYIVT